MKEHADLREVRAREMAWRCPRCGRIFRHHVFAYTTLATGPMCNACCVELEWAEVEKRAAAGAAQKFGEAYHC